MMRRFITYGGVLYEKRMGFDGIEWWCVPRWMWRGRFPLWLKASLRT